MLFPSSFHKNPDNHTMQPVAFM